MKSRFVTFSVFVLLLFAAANTSFAQEVMLGPRITGNFNIYNEKNSTVSWNGIGVGVGGTVDISFNKHIGLMGNITFFDMRNFSESTTANDVTTDVSYYFTYLTIDPMFKAEFSGFYMVLGPSVAIKINASGERTEGNNPVVTINTKANSMTFDIATGLGYTFALSPNSMYMATDFLVYIPLTKTFDFSSLPNSEFTMKFGVSLKFKL